MIDKFRGKYFFLSNFYPCNIDGFTTLEHAFQAAKAVNPSDADDIAKCSTPGKAKRMGRKIAMDPNWDSNKLGVMKDLVRKKFEDPELKRKLLATGNEVLVEGNTWGDEYWGINDYTGKGQNWLGHILMEVREEIRGQELT